MKPFAQARSETAGKVRLEQMWIKREGKLVCVFVKALEAAKGA